jgi:hypothetical protein
MYLHFRLAARRCICAFGGCIGDFRPARQPANDTPLWSLPPPPPPLPPPLSFPNRAFGNCDRAAVLWGFERTSGAIPDPPRLPPNLTCQFETRFFFRAHPPPPFRPCAELPTPPRPPLHWDFRGLCWRLSAGRPPCIGALSWVHLGTFAPPARKFFKLFVVVKTTEQPPFLQKNYGSGTTVVVTTKQTTGDRNATSCDL